MSAFPWSNRRSVSNLIMFKCTSNERRGNHIASRQTEDRTAYYKSGTWAKANHSQRVSWGSSLPYRIIRRTVK